MIFIPFIIVFPQAFPLSADITIGETPENFVKYIPKTGLGLGVAVWDKYMTSPQVLPKIREMGVSILRYPGGSYSDIYHWQTGSGTKGTNPTIAKNTNFDAFMKLDHQVGATPLITVNYGSNLGATDGASPNEAAAWVRYANKTHSWKVKYWEIGNEVYGNGFYNGQGWEEDLHSSAKGKLRKGDALLSPTTYANNLLKFIYKMKAIDPTIKIGAIMTTPGEWPDQVKPYWNKTVLGIVGNKVDFLVIHRYGFGKEPKVLFQSIRQEPNKISSLQELEKEQCPSRVGKIPVWVTEGDSGGFNLKPEGAPYAADEMLTWLEGGASNMDWWDEHNGVGSDGNGGFDDQGIFSNGSTYKSYHEPAVNTPFPPYFGIQMAHLLMEGNSQFVPVESSNPEIRVFEATNGKGKTSMLIINEDLNQSAKVKISMRLGKFLSRTDYVSNQSSVQFGTNSGFAGNMIVQVKPYELTLLKFANQEVEGDK